MSRSDRPSRLVPFFEPRRIAIVGASERGMYPAGILRNLLDHGFPGEIYPVNPKRATVFGLPCYPDLAHTPAPADLAILTVPRQAVLLTLRQCLATGVPAALIISAGFAEADNAGRRMQAEISDLLRNPSSLGGESGGTGLTVIGPNCAGTANIPGRVIATRLPAPPKAGPISFVSASGALMMAIYGLLADRHLGLSRLISLGNQVDVTFAESLAYVVADPQTSVVGAFVEGLPDGRTFVRAARQALTAGKPIVLVKSGRTETGQRAALTGSDRVFDAACRQFGVIRVDDVEQLVDTLQVLAAVGPALAARSLAADRPLGRVSVVTQSGGLGSLTADLCEMAGLKLPPLNDRLVARLRALPTILEFGALENPTDVRGPAVIGAASADTLAPFLEDPDTDAVILLLAKSSVRKEDAATAEAIVAASQTQDKPLLVVWVGQRYPVGEANWPLAHRFLADANMPLFRQPGDAVHALARAVDYWRFRASWLGDPEVADVLG